MNRITANIPSHKCQHAAPFVCCLQLSCV